jgi:hypothetical protein
VREVRVCDNDVRKLLHVSKTMRDPGERRKSVLQLRTISRMTVKADLVGSSVRT